MTWRDECRPIVARVLAETAGQPWRVQHRALQAARPTWFTDTSWGRQVWTSEVRRQRSIKPKAKTLADIDLTGTLFERMGEP